MTLPGTDRAKPILVSTVDKNRAKNRFHRKKRCKACKGTGERFGKRPIPTVCGDCFGRGYTKLS